MATLDRRTQMLDELREIVAAAGLDTCDIPVNSGRTNQLGAINRAKALTSKMVQPSWPRDQKMALTARILADAGHGGTLSGQISCRDNNETRAKEGLHFWTQVYGVPLELIRPSDFILVNDRLEVVDGNGFPNLANRFHLHVYKARPDINCFVHTHPTWTNALSMTGLPLHIGHMDTMALYDQVAHIPDWPGVPFGDEEGEIIQTALGKSNWGVLAAHHGLMVGGRTIEEATYRAIFFEHAAEMQIKALSAIGGNFTSLPDVDRITAERAREWRISPGPVKAHFNSWARQALRNHGDVFQ
eukprot:g20943.t1